VPSLRVLFLSQGNRARGLMAYGFLRKFGRGRFFVNAAGLTNEKADPLAMYVMLEKGIDVTRVPAWEVGRFLGKEHFHHLIVLAQEVDKALPVFPGAVHRQCWSIPDPSLVVNEESARLASYRRTRDLLNEKIEAWVADLEGKGEIAPVY
jgi:arsenate reductase